MHIFVFLKEPICVFMEVYGADVCRLNAWLLTSVLLLLLLRLFVHTVETPLAVSHTHTHTHQIRQITIF